MFTDRRPLGLKIVVFFAILNSLATVTHFVLLDRGIFRTTGLVQNFWVYAVTVTVIAVLPVALGAYGLFYKRMWGLGFFTFGSGAFLCASGFVLLTSVEAQKFGIMFYFAIYLILYSFLANLYTWAFRHHLREF